eukprot:scaffold12957_cov92-Isochrysis_galbana.AAC.5
MTSAILPEDVAELQQPADAAYFARLQEEARSHSRDQRQRSRQREAKQKANHAPSRGGGQGSKKGEEGGGGEGGTINNRWHAHLLGARALGMRFTI